MLDGLFQLCVCVVAQRDSFSFFVRLLFLSRLISLLPLVCLSFFFIRIFTAVLDSLKSFSVGDFTVVGSKEETLLLRFTAGSSRAHVTLEWTRDMTTIQGNKKYSVNFCASFAGVDIIGWRVRAGSRAVLLELSRPPSFECNATRLDIKAANGIKRATTDCADVTREQFTNYPVLTLRFRTSQLASDFFGMLTKNVADADFRFNSVVSKERRYLGCELEAAAPAAAAAETLDGASTSTSTSSSSSAESITSSCAIAAASVSSSDTVTSTCTAAVVAGPILPNDILYNEIIPRLTAASYGYLIIASSQLAAVFNTDAGWKARCRALPGISAFIDAHEKAHPKMHSATASPATKISWKAAYYGFSLFHCRFCGTLKFNNTPGAVSLKHKTLHMPEYGKILGLRVCNGCTGGNLVDLGREINVLSSEQPFPLRCLVPRCVRNEGQGFQNRMFLTRDRESILAHLTSEGFIKEEKEKKKPLKKAIV